MEAAIVIASHVFTYLMGVLLGWTLRSSFGSRREKMFYYRYGIARGLRFWAKVVVRRQRRWRMSNGL